MRFHNYFPTNDDHLNLLIKTGYAHKERMVPQNIIKYFKKCDEVKD